MLTKLNQHLLWASFAFKAAFALGALEQSFSGALQVGLLKHLGDVATVLLDLVCLSLFSFFLESKNAESFLWGVGLGVGLV